MPRQGFTTLKAIVHHLLTNRHGHIDLTIDGNKFSAKYTIIASMMISVFKYSSAYIFFRLRSEGGQADSIVAEDVIELLVCLSIKALFDISG